MFNDLTGNCMYNTIRNGSRKARWNIAQYLRDLSCTDWPVIVRTSVGLLESTFSSVDGDSTTESTPATVASDL